MIKSGHIHTIKSSTSIMHLKSAFVAAFFLSSCISNHNLAEGLPNRMPLSEKLKAAKAVGTTDQAAKRIEEMGRPVINFTNSCNFNT